MFINNAECSKWLLKHGIFLYRDDAEHMSVIARKHKNDRVEFISNPNTFLEKLEQNIAVFNADEALLTEVIFSDFKAYDEREQEITEHKKLISDLRKESVNFLNIKHAVLCKSANQKVIVFDLDTGRKHNIDSALADGLDTCGYHVSIVSEAYQDAGVNQHAKKYERALKNYNKVKAVK